MSGALRPRQRQAVYDGINQENFTVIPHMDDVKTTVFFANQLEQIATKTYDRRYPQLKAKQFVPMDASIGPGTSTLRVRSYSSVGMAKFISSYADDLPRADVAAVETTVNFHTTGDSYGYSFEEIRRAQAGNFPLSDRKAEAARRAMAYHHDRVLAGKEGSALGLYGLLNQPNASLYTIPVGASTTTPWATKTPQEILEDAVGIVDYVRTTTNGIEQPNMLVMPPAQYLIFTTTQYNEGSDLTIADWFKKSKPGVAVEEWDAIDGAGTGGADRLMAYVLDADHLQGAEPIEFLQHNPEQRGLETIVACEGKIGGVILYYPMSVAYGDGI